MPNKTVVIRGRRYRIAPQIKQKTAASKRMKSARHHEAKDRRMEKAELETWGWSDDTFCDDCGYFYDGCICYSYSWDAYGETFGCPCGCC